MKLIKLNSELPDSEVDKFGGKFLPEGSFDTLISDDCDVLKPDGEVLLKYRRSAIPNDLCKVAFPVFREAATETNNRGMAAGQTDVFTGIGNRKVGKMSSTRVVPMKRDGTISKTNYALNTVKSGIIGYTDRSPRFPYCRLTAFNLSNQEKFSTVMPFIQFVDGVFKENMPERYKAQMGYVQKTSDDFYIHGTSFTTVTVNKNFRTAVHKDEGDLKEGFGVMSCLRAGEYKGGYLCFPKYRVAVDMRTGDVLMADVHSWHGNTEINGRIGQFERISLVFYYREGMKSCGSVEDERKRASEVTEKFYNKQVSKI